MKKKSCFWSIISMVISLIAVAALVAGIVMHLEKKKEEEELEYYLDGSIQ